MIYMVIGGIFMALRFRNILSDIYDGEKDRIYDMNNRQDIKDITLLLNDLNYDEDIILILKEEYEESLNYIDEYSLMKSDILEDLLSKCGVDV